MLVKSSPHSPDDTARPAHSGPTGAVAVDLPSPLPRTGSDRSYASTRPFRIRPRGNSPVRIAPGAEDVGDDPREW